MSSLSARLESRLMPDQHQFNRLNARRSPAAVHLWSPTFTQTRHRAAGRWNGFVRWRPPVSMFFEIPLGPALGQHNL